MAYQIAHDIHAAVDEFHAAMSEAEESCNGVLWALKIRTRS